MRNSLLKNTTPEFFLSRKASHLHLPHFFVSSDQEMSLVETESVIFDSLNLLSIVFHLFAIPSELSFILLRFKCSKIFAFSRFGEKIYFLRGEIL